VQLSSLSAEARLVLHTGTSSVFPSMRILNYVKLKDAVRILSRKRRCAAVRSVSPTALLLSHSQDMTPVAYQMLSRRVVGFMLAVLFALGR
jgi:hypothetical protein